MAMTTSPETLGSGNLEILNPIRPDYANFDVDVTDSFDWAKIFEALNIPTEKSVVIYVFRGIEREDVEPEVLEGFDKRALLAAEDAKGFIHYQPNVGLSYCIWESTDDAQAATNSPEHRAAAMYAPRAYERWELRCWDASMSLPGNVEFVHLWTRKSS